MDTFGSENIFFFSFLLIFRCRSRKHRTRKSRTVREQRRKDQTAEEPNVDLALLKEVHYCESWHDERVG